MQRRRLLLLLAAALAVGVLAALQLAPPRTPEEPVYHGKKFSQWVDEAAAARDLRASTPAHAAVAAIGTNGLPFLLHEFSRPLSPWNPRVMDWANGWLPARYCLRNNYRRPAAAAEGLVLLGTNAAPGAPVVIQKLGEQFRGQIATELLYQMGDAALPHLYAALASPDGATVTNIFATLQKFAGVPGPGRQTLAAALHHPSAGVRAGAVQAWAVARMNEADVVPDLLKLRHDPSPRVVQEVSNQLAWLGARAPPPIGPAASNALLTLRTNAPPPRPP